MTRIGFSPWQNRDAGAGSSAHAALDGEIRQTRKSLYIHVYIGTIEAAHIWRQAVTRKLVTALHELSVALRILNAIFL